MSRFSLPTSVFQLFKIFAVASTFKSKSNLNWLVTVPLLLLVLPTIESSFVKSPVTSNTFNVCDTSSQPFSATVPEMFLPTTWTISFSKNADFSNSGVNCAKSVFFITLPKLFSCWYVPPVIPSPTKE